MDSVIVLMSTYNGEKYLREQIDSILAQKDVAVHLLVRDDGSTDKTKEILTEYSDQGNLTWYTGENLRPAASFMNLIMKADDAEYYALSDQDDYWLPEKLSKAVLALKQADHLRPALYCSPTTLTDENLRPIRDDRTGSGALTVKQALVTSGAAGCTMCFNPVLLRLLRKPHPPMRLMHDNWIYKVCSVTGGYIIKDEQSFILYRQHGNNAIGGFAQKEHPLRRHLDSIRREKRYRSEAIQSLCEAYREDMPSEYRQIAENLAYYRKGLKRWEILMDLGYMTGNKRNDFLFRVSILLGLF